MLSRKAICLPCRVISRPTLSCRSSTVGFSILSYLFVGVGLFGFVLPISTVGFCPTLSYFFSEWDFQIYPTALHQVGLYPTAFCWAGLSNFSLPFSSGGIFLLFLLFFVGWDCSALSYRFRWDGFYPTDFICGNFINLSYRFCRADYPTFFCRHDYPTFSLVRILSYFALPLSSGRILSYFILPFSSGRIF